MLVCEYILDEYEDEKKKPTQIATKFHFIK